MFKTWLTEALGIKYPIIQGSMQWLSRAELVSAVANAGGLGILNAGTFATAEELRQEIKKTKSLTNKPFAVNITLMPTRRPINWDEYINAAIEEGITIFETSGRSPEPYMAWFKEAEAKVMHKVARIRDAKTAERLGVDAVTVVGFEGGGHLSMEDVTSLVRLPICVDAVKIPVIAAGGFGDGRGLVAALALGAAGVLMSTRFMASQECPLHPNIKELLRQTDEAGTMLIERSIRNTARVIRTGFSSRILEMEEKGATLEELFPWIDGTRSKRAYASGDTNDSILYSGQVVGLIHDIPTVKEIIDRIMDEAKLVGQRLRRIGVTV